MPTPTTPPPGLRGSWRASVSVPPGAELRGWEGSLGRGPRPAEWCAGLQVRVLELEKTLEAERVRLGELRKQHYVLAGVVGAPGQEEPAQPSAVPRSGASRKPPLAQKPSLTPKQDHQVGPPRAKHCARTGGPWGVRPSLCSQVWGAGPWEGQRSLTSRSGSAVPAVQGASPGLSCTPGHVR